MNNYHTYKRRHMLPRWRKYGDAIQRKETNSLTSKTGNILIPQTELRNKIKDWKENKNLFVASDLIGTALMANQPEAGFEAAKFITSQKKSSNSLSSLAHILLDNVPSDETKYKPKSLSTKEIYTQIRKYKHRLRDIPYNALGWSNLSYYYGIIGEVKKAVKSALTAKALAPNSRYIIRSLCRLLIHDERDAQALFELRNSSILKFDPWLLSTEIAVSQKNNKTSRNIKRALNIINSGKYSDFHLSELRTSIANLELQNGKIKRAVKLFKEALNDTNENVIAQIEWASKKLSSDILGNELFDNKWSYEARAKHFWRIGDWKRALNESRYWLFDEPFSSSPAIDGSFIASVFLDDHKTAFEFLKLGIKANPNNWQLKNNKVVSLSYSGKIKEAEEEFNRIDTTDLKDLNKYTLKATEGLIAFTKGHTEEGRLCYSRAIDGFTKLGKKNFKLMAMLFLAYEEIKSNSSFANEQHKKVIDFSKGTELEYVKTFLKKLSEIRKSSKI